MRLPFRVGILDITVAIIVLVAIFLPPRAMNVSHAYETDPATARRIALNQARLAADPSDGTAAEALVRDLLERGQHDWALRVAAEAADAGKKAGSEDHWRALLALSAAHARRVEVKDALKLAAAALAACREARGSCSPEDVIRVQLYHDQLEAGVASGIDPRLDPHGFHEAAVRILRIIRVRGGTPPPAPEPDEDPQPDEE